MAENQFMCGLKRQYGKTLGLLHSASGDRVRLMADLAHLAAVIRMFRPGEDVEAIRLPYGPTQTGARVAGVSGHGWRWTCSGRPGSRWRRGR